MKRIALFFLFVGSIFCIIGVYLFSNKKENVIVAFKPSVDSSVSKDEETNILNYLKSKYSDDFIVKNHKTNYCSFISSNQLKEDYTCEKNEIMNDIYEIIDKNDVVFYVKKITSENEHDKSVNNYEYYDNYISYIIEKKVSSELREEFEEIGEISSLYIYDGIGIEEPLYKINNNQYVYYVLYFDLNRNDQIIVNKDISIEEYLSYINSSTSKKNIKIHIIINTNLENDNLKNIIKIIHDNKYLNLKYGLEAKTILFEFKNKYYINYEDGLSFEILKYSEDIFSDNEKVYDKKIVMDYALSKDDTIFYDDFMDLDLKLNFGEEME